MSKREAFLLNKYKSIVCYCSSLYTRQDYTIPPREHADSLFVTFGPALDRAEEHAEGVRAKSGPIFLLVRSEPKENTFGQAQTLLFLPSRQMKICARPVRPAARALFTR